MKKNSKNMEVKSVANEMVTKLSAVDDSAKYTPEQLIKSSTYSHRRDVLRTLLDDNGMYSHAEIAEILKEFYSREVKQ